MSFAAKRFAHEDANDPLTFDGRTDDALSDDALEGLSNPIMLPSPDLSNLGEVEQMIVATSTTQAGRDAIARFVIQEQYIMKLLPLVSVAEDLESLPDLHRLCNIMKSLILLNDNTIIEQVVSDPVISGVVGALECMTRPKTNPQASSY